MLLAAPQHSSSPLRLSELTAHEPGRTEILPGGADGTLLIQNEADYDAVAARCDQLEEKLETCSELAEISNRREGLFGQRLTDYGVIEKLKEEFSPYF